MRAIDADKIKQRLQENHDFYVNAYGGYKNLPVKEKARVDEITSCISDVVNAPTIDVAPAVEAEPVRHGRWEKGGYACGETEWKCSVCGETEWRTSCSRMKFCMFCGAEMDAGQEGDENA